MGHGDRLNPGALGASEGVRVITNTGATVRGLVRIAGKRECRKVAIYSLYIILNERPRQDYNYLLPLALLDHSFTHNSIGTI